ncbi:MAG TPA: hypothetical protein VKU19_02975 [Bryobacteraceae bacterium]|nr:hypothetical protein [Bryobacteraceae bacterium]
MVLRVRWSDAEILGLRLRPSADPRRVPAVLALAILLGAAADGLFAHPDASPSFQSVSIQRNTSPGG